MYSTFTRKACKLSRHTVPQPKCATNPFSDTSEARAISHDKAAAENKHAGYAARISAYNQSHTRLEWAMLA